MILPKPLPLAKLTETLSDLSQNGRCWWSTTSRNS